MLRNLRLLLLVGLVAAVAACGGGGQPAQPAGSIKVTMTEFKFDPSSLSAKSGKVTFFLVNTGNTAHDMVITDASGKQVAKSDQVSPGDSSVFAVDSLAAGTYSVFCDLPGHKESGMTATLQVT